MTPTISISLPPESQALIRKMAALPEQMLGAIARGMDAANELAIGTISTERLSGKGPFPVDEGRLGVVTGRLRSSLRRTNSVISGNRVTGAIGTNVEYAGIHEFGGVIQRTTKPGKVRLRTDRHGNLLKRGNLATFAKDKHKLAREVSYEGGKAYTVNVPARAPIGHGIADAMDRGVYTTQITAALRQLWEAQA